jgi:hypothetical protein
MNTPQGRKLVADNLVKWLANGRRGTSSNTIVQHLTGIPTTRYGETDYPHDPDDLSRCRLLLEEVPELQPEFHRMATLSSVWAELVNDWQRLCDLMDSEAPQWREGKGNAPNTLAFMRVLISVGQRRDYSPAKAISGGG